MISADGLYAVDMHEARSGAGPRGVQDGGRRGCGTVTQGAKKEAFGVHDRYTQNAVRDGSVEFAWVASGQAEISRFPPQIRIF